jgi:hypothetical protein
VIYIVGTLYILACVVCFTNVHHNKFAFTTCCDVGLNKVRTLSRNDIYFYWYYQFKVSYEHFKVVILCIALSDFKNDYINKSIVIFLIIFSSLNFIKGKFTLILKLTLQNVFYWTQICYDVR